MLISWIGCSGADIGAIPPGPADACPEDSASPADAGSPVDAAVDAPCPPDAVIPTCLIDGCAGNLVCEQVQDSDPACFAPVEVRGTITSLADSMPVVGARITALNVQGAAIGSVAVSSPDGSYSLPVPSPRLAGGTPAPMALTLRVDAAGFQSFPGGGLHQALPIHTDDAVDTGVALVIQSAPTDIGLEPAPAGAGTSSLRGAIALPASRTSALVVAEAGGMAYTAYTDSAGQYRIFNLPAALYTVTAYARGVSYVSMQADVPAETELQLDLAPDSAQPGTVMGSVTLVNVPGDSTTTVGLVLQSLFDQSLNRGPIMPELEAFGVAGPYTIDGVPPGRYIVQAAFANDGLVRDPDMSICGDCIVSIEVRPGMTTQVDGIKITSAIELITPGSMGPEDITGIPIFRWQDISSEDEYLVEVLGGLGTVIWSQRMAAATEGEVSMTYAGPALVPGVLYQVRISAQRNGISITRTEDMKGVFRVR